jgi:hypothetical protein
MNVFERPFAERLQAEAARIPLPPRERWTPPERSRPRLLPVMAAFAWIVLVALVAAPLVRELDQPSGGAASTSFSPRSESNAASAACGPQDPTALATCLIHGTLVEIVGHDGGLMASTRLLRVRLDDPGLSAQFGNPTLFETDARTQIEPPVLQLTGPIDGGDASPSTIAATGVKVGAPVLVAFDARAPKTSSGAYLLTRFVVVSWGDLPNCLKFLHIERFPQGPTEENGGATPEAAFRAANPTITHYSLFPMGGDAKAPVWIVAGSQTFIATILGDGTWFVSPATFNGCRDPREIQRKERPASTGEPAATQMGAFVPRPFVPGTITPADVAAGMPAGAAMMAGTDPTCLLESDGTTYRCALKNAPAPEIANFLGAKEALVIAGVVAGGCVGLDRDGMTWNCFIGQEAVDRRIIGKLLLGQPAPFPLRG